jgi:hypothetical protein
MDDETIKEVARASRAIAKTTGKGIEAVRDFGGWLNKVFGRAIVNTFDLAWTDRVETLRVRAAIYDYKKLVLLARAVEKDLAKKGIKKPKAVPPKIALPLIENATMENEPRLSALWAKLLASGMAGEKIEKSYVTVLGELTGRDATALNDMYESWRKNWKKGTSKNGPITYENGIDSIGVSETSKLIAFGVLEPTSQGLMLFQLGGTSRWGDYGDSYEEASVPGALNVVKFTQFGIGFCEALGMGKKKRSKRKK